MKYGLIAFLTVTTLELTKGKRNSLAITRSGKKDHDTMQVPIFNLYLTDNF